MSSNVRSKPKDKKAKLSELLNKALDALKNTDNSDELVTLVRLITKDQGNYIISIGKCSGRNRPFPCIVIDNGTRQITLSAMQLNMVIKVINAMSDETYDTLVQFISNAQSVRPIRRREVKDEGEIETESTNEATEEESDSQ